jgi:hypothetical protein
VNDYDVYGRGRSNITFQAECNDPYMAEWSVNSRSFRIGWYEARARMFRWVEETALLPEELHGLTRELVQRGRQSLARSIGYAIHQAFSGVWGRGTWFTICHPTPPIYPIFIDTKRRKKIIPHSPNTDGWW